MSQPGLGQADPRVPSLRLVCDERVRDIGVPAFPMQCRGCQQTRLAAEEPGNNSVATKGSVLVIPVALMIDLPAVVPRHGVRRRAIHVFLLLLSAKTWMPTSVGMTVRGIDHESKLSGHWYYAPKVNLAASSIVC
jgi:hypothetical protein